MSSCIYFSAFRQRGRFAGFSLYVSNTTEKNSGYLCYKNKDVLPPLDFNTSCSIQGRYVIYYNERLKGKPYPSGFQNSSVFTELCEVTVTGKQFARHDYTLIKWMWFGTCMLSKNSSYLKFDKVATPLIIGLEFHYTYVYKLSHQRYLFNILTVSQS